MIADICIYIKLKKSKSATIEIFDWILTAPGQLAKSNVLVGIL